MQDFAEIHIINLKGNARTSGERRRREGGNIFDDKIRVGVAICLLVKREIPQLCDIYYLEVGDYVKAPDKLIFLNQLSESDLTTNKLSVNRTTGRWLGKEHTTGWDSLLILADNSVKATSMISQEISVFKAFSNGIVSARDDWVTDQNKRYVWHKTKFFVKFYRMRCCSGKNPINALQRNPMTLDVNS